MKSITSSAQVTVIEAREDMRAGPDVKLLNMSLRERASLSLAQRLTLFDTAKHGGEVMASCGVSARLPTANGTAPSRAR